MGLEGYHIAISDFEQNDRGGYNALEVAIISRLPLGKVLEFDRSPDNQTGDPEERTIELAADELPLNNPEAMRSIR